MLCRKAKLPNGLPLSPDKLTRLENLTKTLQTEFGFVAFFGCELEWYVLSPADPGVIADFHEAVTVFTLEEKLGSQVIVPEKGHHQFETAFIHRRDACDLVQAIHRFKQILQETADHRGITVSFVAKPFPDDYGSALQLHISLVDENGNPQFEKRGDFLSPTLFAALGGLLETLPEAMVFAAPNSESYARFVPGKDAPVTVSWGGNNRTVALRLPLKNGPFTQIEYRIGGVDANPADLMAAMLAGVIHGLKTKPDPGPQIHGIASDAHYKLPRLPMNLEEAKLAYIQGGRLKKYFL